MEATRQRVAGDDLLATTPGAFHGEGRLTGLARQRLLVGALLATDVVALVAGALIAYVVRFYVPIPLFRDVELSPAMFAPMLFAMLAIWLSLFAVMGLYAEHNLLGGTREYALVFNACTAAVVLVVLVSYLAEGPAISRGLLALGWLLTFVSASTGRFIFRRLIYRLRRNGYFLRPTLIVGANAEGRALARQLEQSGASGMQVLGFVEEAHDGATRGWPVLGDLDELSQLVERHRVEQLIVATGGVSRDRLLDIVSQYGRSRKVNLLFSSGLFEVLTTGVQVQERAFVPLISLNKTRLRTIDVFAKAVLDLAITAPVLILLAPVFLVIALAIKLDSPGPVIYRRRVLGLQREEFDAYKFRTMRVDWEQAVSDDSVRQQFVVGVKPKDDPRVTRVGRLLRRYSLDELPQLINVLRRQMSLVGPRMITEQESAFYEQWLMNLLTVRPGITGLWQVSGRADTSYEEKVRLDMTYIRNYSIWLDLQILWQTLPVILGSKGAY
jgi:exopolysaccharide biosynthesis polyprenyl glycosylphosphotransferase